MQSRAQSPVRAVSRSLIGFADEFSRAKTPCSRTQGFEERPGQVRGQGDRDETIGVMTCAALLTDEGIPAIAQLATLRGDEFDLRAGFPGHELNINIKTSRWDPGDDVCRLCRLFVKKVEFAKLPDLFVQMMVHVADDQDEEPHAHFCGWVATDSELFQSQEETILPNTGGELGYLIKNKDLQPFEALIKRLRSRSL